MSFLPFPAKYFVSCNYRILFLIHSVIEYVTCTVFRAKAAEQHSLPTVNIKIEQKICVNPKPKKKARLYCKPINCKGANARKNITYKDTSLLACFALSFLKYLSLFPRK